MSQRLFVGNLPQGVTSDDLKNEFNAYGTVSNVELKIKDNLVDPDNPNVFAFITLDINRQMINQCINEFSQQEYRGRFLNVSVAKESFLDRLKREREEANLKNSNKSANTEKEVTTPTPTKKIETKKNVVSPKIKKDSSSSSESSDSESESEKEKQKTKITSVEKHKSVNGTIESKKDSSSSSGSSDSDSESSSESKKKKQKTKVTSAEKCKRVNGKNESSILDHGEEDEIFIAKKRASNSLQNGRIRIESTTNEPIHVITKKPKINEKDFDEKARISDLKRKESLNKMKNQYNQQKLAIQKALSSVDTNKSKKVVFNDDEDDNETSHLEQSTKKINLFDGEDDDDDDENFEKNFEIKSQYEGKSGEKLMKLQSKFKLDPRFRMNEKFLEDNEEDKEDYNRVPAKNNQKSSKKDQPNAGGDGDDDDERKWQLGIIEKVIGRKLENLSEPHKKKLPKPMLRYDPTKPEDQKFLRKVEKNSEVIENKSDKKDHQKEAVEVSKEQFYHVSEDLTKSFKEQSGGFSLLSLFRNIEETENSGNFAEKDTSSSITKPVLIPKVKNLIDNPFKFDSSDSESENEVEPITKSKTVEPMEVNSSNQIDKSSAEGGKTTKTGIWHENFFIFKGDQRLKDGIAFFQPIKRDNDEEPEDYDKIREDLRQVIKKKIIKSKKIQNRSKKGKFRRK